MVAVVYQWLYKTRGDVGLVITTAGGLSMAMLVAVRALSGGYLSEAEKINFDFLRNPETGDEDILIGSKFGDELIAALALRLERPGGGGAVSASGKKKGRANLKGGKGVIRAWTTRLRYRGKGVGQELLEEAVRITRESCGKDAEVGFAADHANSKTVLPEIFNGVFRKREQKAIRMLEELLDESGKKRR